MPAGPLVILTQTAADNDRLSGLLESRGVPSFSYPCISLRFLDFDPLEEIAGLKLAEYGLLAFTSRRGVIGFEAAKACVGPARPLIACVGESTAAEFAARFGRDADIVPGQNQTAAGLIDEILGHCAAPLPVLHVRGSRSSGQFAEALRSLGWSVGELVVYHNDQPDLAPLDAGEAWLAVFASPSAASRFFEVNPGLRDSVACVAIGPVTADCLKDLGINRIETAGLPDNQSIAEAVAKLYREVNTDGSQSQ